MSLSRLNKYKRVLYDVFLNLTATGISLVILEVFIYPLLADKMNAEEYGQMQTTVSLIFLISTTSGQSLSTTRLVRRSEYDEAQCVGDFNYLLLCTIPASVVTFVVVCVLCVGFDSFLSLLLAAIVSLIVCILGYYEVGFRLELNYKKILCGNLIAGVGYVVGFFFFLFVKQWQIVFIASYLSRLIYCILNTPLSKETYQKTSLFETTQKTYFTLTLSNLLSKSLAYIDKLLLYPMLGGSAVSIYFTANLMGKLVLKVLEPITNVCLSYLSKKNKISQRQWSSTLLAGSIFCIVAYLVCIFISKPILTFFYPRWAEEAMKFIPITTLTLCVSSLTSILYPFSLKIINISYQYIINGVCVALYLILTSTLVARYGLLGSCISLLFAYAVKLFIMIVLCIRSVDKSKRKLTS